MSPWPQRTPLPTLIPAHCLSPYSLMPTMAQKQLFSCPLVERMKDTAPTKVQRWQNTGLPPTQAATEQ